MRSRLKMILKKCPFLYRIVVSLYSNVNFRLIQERVIGTKAREKEWENRHKKKGNDWGDTSHKGSDDEWVMSYWDSMNHSHRPALLDKIDDYSPISSILEFGCNCGPNLYLLAKKYPGIEISGIDINTSAIEVGRRMFKEQGISNVDLIVGGMSDLSQFQDKSYDVVFTDAVLIYIGKDAIEQVIREMVRISRKGLVFTERHLFETDDSLHNRLGIRQLGLWHRDYKALLEQYIPRENITISKITEEVWSDPGWQESGAFIQAGTGTESVIST